jgi:NTP pyrophosphatase (non-canonical NTP hydrolase)
MMSDQDQLIQEWPNGEAKWRCHKCGGDYIAHLSTAPAARHRCPVDAFQDLYRLEVLNRKNSPWARARTLRGWVEELQEELDELKVALSQDPQSSSARVREEIADVFNDALHLVMAASGYCGPNAPFDLIFAARDKIMRRKPWLHNGSDPPQTVEEELAIWNRIKEKERKR